LSASVKPVLRGAEVDIAGLAYLYSRLPFLLQHFDQINRALYLADEDSEGVPQPQYFFLEILDKTGPLSQISLGRLAGVDSSTASSIITRLVSRHRVERSANPADGREKLVSVTQIGRAAAARGRSAYQRTQQTLLSGSGVELPRFRAIVSPIAHAADSGAPAWQPELATASARRSLGPLFESPGFIIRRALQHSEVAILESIGPFDLTIRQYATLLVLNCHDPVTEADLCRLLGYDASNAALVVNLLVEKGLAAVTNPHSNARRRYRASHAGRALLADKEPAMQGLEARLFAPVSAADAAQLKQVLARIVMKHGNSVQNPLVAFAAVFASAHWQKPQFRVGRPR